MRRHAARPDRHPQRQRIRRATVDDQRAGERAGGGATRRPLGERRLELLDLGALDEPALGHRECDQQRTPFSGSLAHRPLRSNWAASSGRPSASARRAAAARVSTTQTSPDGPLRSR